ncbi:MAG: hypothetical protein LBG79_07420 [Spirochaetaceae bacterium]|nr:hypothetical protein [Spirochaetaceae bacterium]
MNAAPRWELRPRSIWEAADLGVLIWRRGIWILLLFFTLPMIATSGFIYFILKLINAELWFNGSVLIIMLFMEFWLKPFFGRFALQVCSKLFFYERPRIKDFFSGLSGALFFGLLGDLLWRRFSPYRGVIMPLRVLERLKGSRLARRREVLASGALYSGAALTFFCLALNAALNAASLVFIYTSSATLGIYDDFSSFLEFRSGVYLALIRINFIISETLYIAMSFAVYINSRVITEGWDLQFIFQKLNSVRKGKAGGGKSTFGGF